MHIRVRHVVHTDVHVRHVAEVTGDVLANAASRVTTQSRIAQAERGGMGGLVWCSFAGNTSWQHSVSCVS